MTDESNEERMRRISRDQYDRPLPKRFYKEVTVSSLNEIELDGRKVKTPLKVAFTAPSRALAEAIAVEWRAQDKVINPGLMPLTKLANTAIDRTSDQRDNIIREMVEYANADMVCYRADRPPELVKMQADNWDPVLDWIASHYGAHFQTRLGVLHGDQPADTLSTIAQALGEMDLVQLTVAYNLCTLTGSALLTLMLVNQALDADAGWRLTHVDEDYQIIQWGHDHEAKRRRELRRVEYDALLEFLRLAKT